MCGIGGVHKFADDPINGEELVIMLCMLERRGTHATGIALVNPDGIHVLKAPDPAWKFTKSKDFENFLDKFLTPETETAIFHTRFATTGDPADNANNHPMFDGETAIVHNGMISNHEWLFRSNDQYKRSCETDSDIIRAIVAEHGFTEKGMRELCKMSGSAAIACVSTKFPHKMLLARSGSPLAYGFTADGDKMYWASEADIILRAARPFHLVRGVWVQNSKADVLVGHMPDHTAWLFGPEEIEFHHLFNVCNYYRKPDYSGLRKGYHAKVANWKKALKKEIKLDLNGQTPSTWTRPQSGWRQPYQGGDGIDYTRKLPALPASTNDLKGAIMSCPGCGCGVKNTEGKPWNQLVCGSCKAGLA